MGSTGEPERKRRHFNSISPTAAAAARKSSPFPCSEDKKLDTVVLQYQNQKLVQQLEAQKVEYFALENKFHQVKEKQKTHDDTLLVVNKSWERLINDLESVSISTRGPSNDGQTLEDGASCPTEDNFLCRLLETGATESCSENLSPSHMEDDIQMAQATSKKVVQKIISAIKDMWHLDNGLSNALLGTLPEDEPIRQLQKTASNLKVEVNNLRVALSNLHLKHRSLGNEILGHRDTNAKDKGEQKRLAGELKSTMTELEESNCKLASLKAQREAGQGKPFLFPTLGNNLVGDKARDKQKDLQDMESACKESLDLASGRLLEIRSLHEKRLEIMSKLSNLQNTLMDVKRVSSSKRFVLTSDQLEKLKAEMDQFQASLEKLQVEKDEFVWREREVTAKVDLADISRRVSAVSESRIAELEKLLCKQVDERFLIESKLEEASREPGRNEIIAEFKTLVSTLPKDMEIMQSQLSKYKEDASEIHSLRAEVRSLANMLKRKANEMETLSNRSADQISEIQKLQVMIRDLKESDQELKLILEMYKRESTDSRDVMESKDLEYRSWAHVQSLKSSLDEHSLEQRVKAANEAEAISQQRLATAEAEIADLRQKLEVSGRDMCKLSEVLKFKREEGEAYLSEIESIGQAYEDMQTQNQHLLQQITERDDYNIKLVSESVKARQLQEALRMEIQTMDKEMQQANASLNFFNLKVGRLEDQLRIWSEQVGKLGEDGLQSSVALQNTNSRLLDVQRDSQQLRESLEEKQAMVKINRLGVSELQIELEKQRFNKKRIEENLEVATRKATQLRAHTEGSSVLEKLQQEIREYRAILKCSICHDRQKEVVIAKCYHLFCNPCVQRTLESRHRKCPACATSFGPNDVKPIYI